MVVVWSKGCWLGGGGHVRRAGPGNDSLGLGMEWEVEWHGMEWRLSSTTSIYPSIHLLLTMSADAPPFFKTISKVTLPS